MQTFRPIGLSFDGKWLIWRNNYAVAVLSGNRILEYAKGRNGEEAHTFSDVQQYLDNASELAGGRDRQDVKNWFAVESELDEKIGALFAQCATEHGDLAQEECEQRCRERPDIMTPLTDRETKLARYLVDSELDRLLKNAERNWRARQ